MIHVSLSLRFLPGYRTMLDPWTGEVSRFTLQMRSLHRIKNMLHITKMSGRFMRHTMHVRAGGLVAEQNGIA